MDKNSPRTYGWYARFYINHITGEPVDKASYGKPANAPGVDENAEVLTRLGLADLVPAIDNLGPLIEMYKAWWPSRDWNEPHDVITLHWIFGDIMQDPTIDPEVLTFALASFPERFVISCLSHPNCPHDSVEHWVKTVSGTKGDPTKKTNGGELAIFVLHNKALASDLVDMCARVMKKATNQRDVINHPNVTRETLVYLSREGRSDRVKKDALEALVKRGFLKVE